MSLQNKAITQQDVEKQERRLIKACSEGVTKLVENQALLEQFHKVFNSEQQPLYLIHGLTENHLDALFETAYRLYTEKKYEDSKGIFSTMALYNHLDQRSWIGLSACSQVMGEYAQAIENYKTASKLDPENPWLYFFCYQCFLKLNQKEDAMKELEKASIISEHYSQHKKLNEEIQKIQQKHAV